MPLRKGKGGHASVADLLNSTTFLESLSPDERTDIFCAARSSTKLAASPEAREPRSGNSPWNSSKYSYQQQEDPEYGDQHPAMADAAIPAVQQAYDALELLDSNHAAAQLMAVSEVDQLRREKQLLQRQEGRLQAKNTSLQYQVSMLLANQKAAKLQGNERLAALEAVINRLQSTMSEVGATAARVAQENRALSAENRQLTAERVQHLELMQQMKSHCRQLETELLNKVTAASQQAAEAAAAAASPLNALITPALLAATARPPGAGSNNSSTLDGGAKIGPALQELASLKRLRDTLQKQVVQLQHQLSAAEREQQSAAAAAAAERARAGRALSRTQQQLAAALQRLQHMADREQQQQAAMQEREDYIAKLEQCLLEQHQQLTQGVVRAAGAVPLRSRSTPRSNSQLMAPVVVHRPQTLSSNLYPGASPDRTRMIQQQLRATGQYSRELDNSDTWSYAPPANTHGTAVAKASSDVDQEPETSPAVAAAAELFMQHQRRPATPAQAARGFNIVAAASAAAATTPQHPSASAAGSPDVNAAKRAAVARQCMNVMLTGSPEGKLALRSASAAQAAVQAVEVQAAVGVIAAVATQEVQTRCPGQQSPQQQQQQQKLLQQQQLGGLQHLQQSRLQQWQQRQLQREQHTRKAAQSFMSSSSGSNLQQRRQPAAPKAEALSSRTAAMQKQQPLGGAIHSQHQKRQQRLRELLQQKQLRQHPQPAKLKAVQQPLQQQQSLALRPQKQRQQQHQQPDQQQPSGQQSLVGSEDSALEDQTQWQELQQEVQQTQDTKAAGEEHISDSSGRRTSAALPCSHTTTTLHAADSSYEDDPVTGAQHTLTALAVPQGLPANHVAACGVPQPQLPQQQHILQQQQQVLQQQRLAQLLDDCSDEELSMHEFSHETAAAAEQQDMLAPADVTAYEQHQQSSRLLSEDQLVARVVEMQQNLQLLEGQLLQLGCS